MKITWIIPLLLCLFQGQAFAFPVTFKKLSGTVLNKSGVPTKKTVYLIGDYHDDDNMFEHEKGKEILESSAAFYTLLRKLDNATLITETPDSPNDEYKAPIESHMMVKFAVATKIDKKLKKLKLRDGDFLRKQLFWDIVNDYINTPILLDKDGSLFAKYSQQIDSFVNGKSKAKAKEHFLNLFSTSLDRLDIAEEEFIASKFKDYFTRLIEMSQDPKTLFNEISRTIILETANLEMFFNIVADDNPTIVLFAGARHLDKQFEEGKGTESIDILLEKLGFKEEESAAIMAPDGKISSSSKDYDNFKKRFIENSKCSVFTKMFPDIPEWIYEGFKYSRPD